MINYSVDVRFISDETLTAGRLQEIACETLRLCEGVGCYRCGMGDDPSITCNQLESNTPGDEPQAGYELEVSASEGPQSWTGAPGWMLVAWRSRGALHFELELDEAPAAELLKAFFDRLHAVGIVAVSVTNRAATPAEHPAACIPQFRSAEDLE